MARATTTPKASALTALLGALVLCLGVGVMAWSLSLPGEEAARSAVVERPPAAPSDEAAAPPALPAGSVPAPSGARPRRPPPPASPPAVADEAPRTVPVGDVGTVLVTGDATEVSLRCAGQVVEPGPSVPAGACTILATFGSAAPTPAGSVTVESGETVTLSCSAAFQRCRSR